VIRLRCVVSGVSPLIVRTLDMPEQASLAVLHEALLTVFDWSDEHLHQFNIRAVMFSGAPMVDAEGTGDVTLGSLGLRVGERFCWIYNFTAGGRSTCGSKPSTPPMTLPSAARCGV
jgi:hypothetical protein